MKPLYLQQGNQDLEYIGYGRTAMKAFEHKGKQVEFRSVTGEITGAHKHAETYVSGSGGGGSTFNGQGHTSPVRISSTVVIKQEFFLKPGEGNQIPVQLSAEDIPLTNGQNITMISGHAGDTGKGIWTHLVNHNAALYWKLGDAKTHTVSWGLVRNPSISFFIGVTLWIAGGYLLNGVIGFLAAAGFWVFEWKNLSNASKALQMHLDILGREALNSSTVP